MFFFYTLMNKKVSFFSSSPELSNKQRFEYFTRTIPSDHHQVMAIVQIIRLLKWTYISILYEESTYGIKVNPPLRTLGDVAIDSVVSIQLIMAAAGCEREQWTRVTIIRGAKRIKCRSGRDLGWGRGPSIKKRGKGFWVSVLWAIWPCRPAFEHLNR